MYLGQQLLLKTGKVDSMNMINGSLIPVSGGGPAGAGLSAVNSLKGTGGADDSDSDSDSDVRV